MDHTESLQKLVKVLRFAQFPLSLEVLGVDVGGHRVADRVGVRIDV